MPGPYYISKNPVKSIVTGEIIDIDDKKITVNLSENINGFIKKSNLSKNKNEQKLERFAKGEKIDSMIISYDNKSRKIVYHLSHDELLRDLLQIKSNHDKIINEMLNHFLYDQDLFKSDVPFEMAVDVLNRLSDKYEIYYLTGRPVHSTAVDFITKFGFPEGKIFSEKIGLGESSKKSVLIREISSMILLDLTANTKKFLFGNISL